MTTKTFSAYQLAIFNNVSDGRGHTVVIARAGSGKTTTIMEALNHVPPECSTLMVAFNKSIADELRTRAPKDVDVLTLHAYGNKAVYRAFGKTRIDGDKVMGMIHEKWTNEEMSFERKRLLAKLVSMSKSLLVGVNEDAKTSYARVDGLLDSPAFSLAMPTDTEDRVRVCSQVLQLLDECKDPKGVIDFDDMIWLPVALNLSTWKYDRVFIDETQDLNPAQIELALRAVRTKGRICAVGDDKQAIYAFRGADVNAIPNVISRLNAKVMPLSVTYRCAKSIVRAVKGLVPDLEWSEFAVEGEVFRETSFEFMKREAKAGDFILSRVNAPLIGLCLAFLREGRQANIQGRDIGTSLLAHVKRAGNKSVAEFCTQVDDWRTGQCIRLAAKGKDTQAVDDTADTLLALCDGAQSLNEVQARIEALFSDGDDKNRIVLSSTHKAKGLERDRVFVLGDTYRRREGSEEDNLYYVALTRARHTLHLVTKAGVDKGAQDSAPVEASHGEIPMVRTMELPSAATTFDAPRAKKITRGMGAMRRAAKDGD